MKIVLAMREPYPFYIQSYQKSLKSVIVTVIASY